MALPQISSADQAKLQLMQEMEIEMMSDLYNRMTNACHKKCIPPRYSESELGEWGTTSKKMYYRVTIRRPLYLALSALLAKILGKGQLTWS